MCEFHSYNVDSDNWNNKQKVRRDQESPIRDCEYCRLYFGAGFAIAVAAWGVFYGLLLTGVVSPDTDDSG